MQSIKVLVWKQANVHKVESIYQNVCNIQDAESEEYSNPASKLCSKLPDCVDVFTLQYLNIILQSYYQMPHFKTTILEIIAINSIAL